MARRTHLRIAFVHADRTALELTLLPGARELLDIHSQELPQRDDLCGAFCAALALRAVAGRVPQPAASTVMRTRESIVGSMVAPKMI